MAELLNPKSSGKNGRKKNWHGILVGYLSLGIFFFIWHDDSSFSFLFSPNQFFGESGRKLPKH